MKSKALILTAVMSVLTLGAVHAATAGWGLPKPEKAPVSLREASAKSTPRRTGTGTRYLIGGGFRGGK